MKLHEISTAGNPDPVDRDFVFCRDRSLNLDFPTYNMVSNDWILDTISNKILGFESFKKKKFNWKNYFMLAGVEHVGGDMFESVPKGDAIFMKVSEYNFFYLI
jgi:hypothetical protein